jgi:hypothetical protein
MLYVGRAQDRARVVGTEPRRSATTGTTDLWVAQLASAAQTIHGVSIVGVSFGFG